MLRAGGRFVGAEPSSSAELAASPLAVAAQACPVECIAVAVELVERQGLEAVPSSLVALFAARAWAVDIVVAAEEQLRLGC